MPIQNNYSLNSNRTAIAFDVVQNTSESDANSLTQNISNIAITPERLNLISNQVEGSEENNPLTPEKYLVILENWAQSAPSAAMKQTRKSMFDTFLTCLKSKSTSLEIIENHLDSLPVLPPHIETLYLYKVGLTELHSLPPGLKELSCIQTKLTSLPELPATLISLYCTDCLLKQLPTLPDKLAHLYCSETKLEQLPECPDSLLDIMVMDNQLTTLPESLISAPHRSIYLNGNPLSEDAINHFHCLRRNFTHSGAYICYSVGNEHYVVETNPLVDSVASWFPSYKPNDEIKKNLALIPNDQNTQAFIKFLGRLGKNINVKSDPKIKQQIAQWLARLSASPDLQQETFSIAFDATTSCDDRVTLAWNEMNKIELVHDVKCGNYDEKLPGLIRTGREMFRLEQLEKIARGYMEQYLNKNGVDDIIKIDEIEVYLAYQTKLRKPLELTRVANDMLYFLNSKLEADDLQSAELQVKTAENTEMSTWLAHWEPMNNVIQRTDVTLWDSKEMDLDKYDSQVSSELSQFIEKNNIDMSNILSKKIIADAEKDLGKKVYDEMNKALLESVTQQYLTKNNYVKSLDNYWKI